MGQSRLIFVALKWRNNLKNCTVFIALSHAKHVVVCSHGTQLFEGGFRVIMIFFNIERT